MPAPRVRDNRVILTLSMREPLVHPDWPAPDFGAALCQGDWSRRLKLYLGSPNIEVNPLTEVPRPGQNNISCTWEVLLG